MASKDEQKKKGMPAWATALIVMVVVLVSGVLGYFGYNYMKKNNANVRPAMNNTMPTMASPTINGAGAGTGNSTGAGNATVSTNGSGVPRAQ